MKLKEQTQEEGGEEPSGDDEFEEQVGQHGGDRRSGTGKKEFGNEYSAKDIKDATKYERERYGKREFKGKSPLASVKVEQLLQEKDY